MALVKKKKIVRKIKNTDSPEKLVPIAAYPMLLHKLREASLEVRAGDNWIRGLGDQNILQLYDMITNGIMDEIIVETARAEWHCPVSVVSRADMAAIKLFRGRIIKHTVHELQPTTEEEKKFRKGYISKARKLLSEFDVIAAAIELVKEQQRRVYMGMDEEVLDERLNSQVSAEISTLNRMLHELITKLQSIGFIEEKPVEHILTMNEQFGSALDLITKTGQNRMLSITSNFMSKLNECCVEMEVGQDGTFVPANQ